MQLYRRFIKRLSNSVEPSAAWQQLLQDDQDQFLAKVNFNPIAFGAFMMVARERDLSTAMRDAKVPDRVKDVLSEVGPAIPKKGQLLSAVHAMAQMLKEYAAAKPQLLRR